MDNIIINYLNETITEEERKKLLSWLEESEDNRKYFADIRDLWITSGTAYSSDKANAARAFALFKRTIIEKERKENEKFSLRANFSKIAASVAVLVFLSLGGYLFLRENGGFSSGNLISSVQENMLVTLDNEKTSVTLPDGTIVWLNENSKLFYPETFSKNNRTVRLEGEGYFEVTRDVNSPFFVEASEMIIKVLGTQFNICNYAEMQLAETVLVSGKVEVSLTFDNSKFILSPDQKISFDKEKESYTIEATDASIYALWASENLTMINEELGTILKKLERWYGVKINYSGNMPLTDRYSMTVRDESKEEIMRVFSMITNLDYRIEKKEIYIYK